MTVNRICLSGTVISDIKSSDKHCVFRVENLTKRGEFTDKAIVDVICLGELAKSCCSALMRGSSVYLEGSVHYKSKELPSGNKRYWTEVEATKVERM